MSKRKTILWLGILVAILPLLGFPASWKSVVFFISGVLIAVNSYQLNKHKAVRGRRPEKRKHENDSSREKQSVPQEVKTNISSDITPHTSQVMEESPNNPFN